MEFLTTNYSLIEPFSLITVGPDGAISGFRLTDLYMEKGKVTLKWLVILGIVLGVAIVAVCFFRVNTKKLSENSDGADELELQWAKDEKVIDGY